MILRSLFVKTLFLLLILVASVEMSLCRADEASALPVSIYQLIANPEKYDGKTVYVIGFMHMEFEGDVVYAHREDWAHSLIQNGVALDVPKSSFSSWKKINNNYVAIQGTFSAVKRGHLALRVGSLTNITKLVKWKKPNP
ncbi:lysyl-tRNA synthetase class II [Duganella sp. 1411]|uniref:hypothetical protein n=1 Tax=Duganella sp. 1411 TaxID=2806572 RepID=UPI001AE6173A|nr:hypothetical protein [Duganella sp. 1411]MBP1204107.1 lysyl-tRNA synthetase class II [Duganella sp. 1411]